MAQVGAQDAASAAGQELDDTCTGTAASVVSEDSATPVLTVDDTVDKASLEEIAAGIARAHRLVRQQTGLSVVTATVLREALEHVMHGFCAVEAGYPGFLVCLDAALRCHNQHTDERLQLHMSVDTEENGGAQVCCGAMHTPAATVLPAGLAAAASLQAPVKGAVSMGASTAPAHGRMQIALLLDYDNLVANQAERKVSEWLRGLMQRVRGMGTVREARAYADWPRFAGQAKLLSAQGVRTAQVSSFTRGGKNSADILLVVEAMDLVHLAPHLDTFVICSGDADMMPLCSRLRALGKRVVTITWSANASSQLKAACDQLLYLDRMMAGGRKALGAHKLGHLRTRLERVHVALRGSTGVPVVPLQLLREGLARVEPDFDAVDYEFPSFQHFVAEALEGLPQLSLLQGRDGVVVAWCADLEKELPLMPGALPDAGVGRKMPVLEQQAPAAAGAGGAAADVTNASDPGAGASAAPAPREELPAVQDTVTQPRAEVTPAGQELYSVLGTLRDSLVQRLRGIGNLPEAVALGGLMPTFMDVLFATLQAAGTEGCRLPELRTRIRSVGMTHVSGRPEWGTPLTAEQAGVAAGTAQALREALVPLSDEVQNAVVLLGTYAVGVVHGADSSLAPGSQRWCIKPELSAATPLHLSRYAYGRLRTLLRLTGSSALVKQLRRVVVTGSADALRGPASGAGAQPATHAGAPAEAEPARSPVASGGGIPPSALAPAAGETAPPSSAAVAQATALNLPAALVQHAVGGNGQVKPDKQEALEELGQHADWFAVQPPLPSGMLPTLLNALVQLGQPQGLKVWRLPDMAGAGPAVSMLVRATLGVLLTAAKRGLMLHPPAVRTNLASVGCKFVMHQARFGTAMSPEEVGLAPSEAPLLRALCEVLDTNALNATVAVVLHCMCDKPAHLNTMGRRKMQLRRGLQGSTAGEGWPSVPQLEELFVAAVQVWLTHAPVELEMDMDTLRHTLIGRPEGTAAVPQAWKVQVSRVGIEVGAMADAAAVGDCADGNAAAAGPTHRVFNPAAPPFKG